MQHVWSNHQPTKSGPLVRHSMDSLLGSALFQTKAFNFHVILFAITHSWATHFTHV